MTQWTDQHERLVAAADPVPAAAPVDHDRTWPQVAAAISGAGTPRRRRRTVVGGIAVAALLGLGGAAGAGVLSSHTGHYASDHEDRVLGGPGEDLDPQGDDFPAVVADVTADIPFPSSRARRVSLDFQVADLRRDDAQVTTGAMAGFVANDAICAWADAWAAATAAGDRQGVAAATGVLDDASNWPAVATLQGLDADRFGWLTHVQRAAHGTSIPALGATLAGRVMCLPRLVPDLPEALPEGMPRCAEVPDSLICVPDRGSSTG